MQLHSSKLLKNNRQRRRELGFTMIELVMVIVLLGILAVTVIMKYQDMATIGKEKSRDTTVASVRTGLAAYRANSLASGSTTYSPATLDASSSASCTGTNVCFTSVLTGGLNDPSWVKTGNTTYTHTDGTTTTTWTYAPATGAGDAQVATFTCSGAGCP